MGSTRQISDIVIGWKDVDAISPCVDGCVKDYSADLHMLPMLDLQQDVTLVSSDRENGYTTITFKRKLDTGDSPSDRAIDLAAVTDWIFAAAEEIPVDDLGEVMKKHKFRGSLAFALNEETGDCPVNPPTRVASSYTVPDGSWMIEWNLVDEGLATDSLEVTVTATINKGWIGFGFNYYEDAGMANSDIVIGWVDASDGQVFATDRFGSENDMPKLDTVRGGTQDYEVIAGGINDEGKMTVTFKRPLITNDSNDVVVENRMYTLIWAWGVQTPSNASDFVFEKHDNRGTFNVNFYTAEVSETDNKLISSHGILMTLSWAVLVPLSVYFARYAKVQGDENWFVKHRAVNIIATILTIAGFAVIVYEKRNKTHFSDDPHGALGLFIFIALFVQITGGIISDKMYKPERQKTPLVDLVHHYSGRMLMLLSFINMGLGLKLFETKAEGTLNDVVITIYTLYVVSLALLFAMQEYSQRKMLQYNSVTERGDAEETTTLKSGARAVEKPETTSQKARRGLSLVLFLTAFGLMMAAFLYIEEGGAAPVSFDPLCEGCTQFEIYIGSYAVPAQRTTYTCFPFVFPVENDVHMIQIEGLVGQLDVVHHIILMQLTEQPTSMEPFACDGMPENAAPMWAWAPGGKIFRTPSEAGFPLGKSSGVVWGAIQMHYDNPTLSSEYVDNTGVRVTVTTKLRKYAASSAFVYVAANFTTFQRWELPPQEPRVELIGACDTTDWKWGDVSELHFFGAGLHGHKHMNKMRTDHFRGGQLIGDLGENLGFDFNAQGGSPIDVVVLPGDVLVNHCEYNTMDSDVPIQEGEGTDMEMCLNVLFYYPKLPALGVVGEFLGTPGFCMTQFQITTNVTFPDKW